MSDQTFDVSLTIPYDTLGEYLEWLEQRAIRFTYEAHMSIPSGIFPIHHYPGTNIDLPVACVFMFENVSDAMYFKLTLC